MSREMYGDRAPSLVYAIDKSYTYYTGADLERIRVELGLRKIDMYRLLRIGETTYWRTVKADDALDVRWCCWLDHIQRVAIEQQQEMMEDTDD